MGLIECVPNISASTDRSVVEAIVSAVRAVSGIKILHVDSNDDANRSVLTYVGDYGPVVEAGKELISSALRLIDMRSHKGAHPRIGVVDVLPFVPLLGSSMEECHQASEQVAAWAGSELDIPVYLYEQSAREERRRSLGSIRAGEFEGLPEKMKKAQWHADYGPQLAPHITFGALVTGARWFLIAFNISLYSPAGSAETLKISEVIARRIRSISAGRGERAALPALKAIGWNMPGYDCAQVSCNLVDFRLTGMYEVYTAVKVEAEKLGAEVIGSELVGLVPRLALLDAGSKFLASKGIKHQEEDIVIEAAVSGLGLSYHQPFELTERVIEEIIK
ncbi:MAG: glutamate formimidoyltransferase [bacterium]|nr:glutamate formimidoyltransferase [bacterium]